MLLTVTRSTPMLFKLPTLVPMQSLQKFHWHVAALVFALTASLRAAEPTVIVTSPPPDATVRELRFVSVVFSEGVTNVDAADLVINNSAATNLLRCRRSSINLASRNRPPAWSPWRGQPATG
ncbi:MAG: hypothetical protein IPK15_06530 [Verrucomicrobia bacterium]|nr:hypothetical protein [Verrucomicrobiota bacterium]